MMARYDLNWAHETAIRKFYGGCGAIYLLVMVEDRAIYGADLGVFMDGVGLVEVGACPF